MKRLIKEITNEVNEIELLQSKVSKKILNKLRQGAKTYADVEDKFGILRKTLFYNFEGNKKYGLIINEVQRLLEEEKSDLLVTNRH